MLPPQLCPQSDTAAAEPCLIRCCRPSSVLNLILLAQCPAHLILLPQCHFWELPNVRIIFDSLRGHYPFKLVTLARYPIWHACFGGYRSLSSMVSLSPPLQTSSQICLPLMLRLFGYTNSWSEVIDIISGGVRPSNLPLTSKYKRQPHTTSVVSSFGNPHPPHLLLSCIFIYLFMHLFMNLSIYLSFCLGGLSELE